MRFCRACLTGSFLLQDFKKGKSNMRKKSILSRIGSTILAGLTALSVVTTSIGNVVTVEAATGASLATTEQIVGRAASLLGTKYSFGAKGGNARSAPE